MDNSKVGYFIAERRKEKQITQQELADKLNITNKAVSKWETGKGFPDISILTELADILDVSVDEILRAKKNDKDISDLVAIDKDKDTGSDKNIAHDSDGVMNCLVNKSITKFKMMSMVSIILSAAGVFTQLFIKKETNDLTGWLFGSWLGICGGGVFYYYRTLMKNQIINYSNTREYKLYTNDISNPYLKFLIIIWAIMLISIVFYW